MAKPEARKGGGVKIVIALLLVAVLVVAGLYMARFAGNGDQGPVKPAAAPAPAVSLERVERLERRLEEAESAIADLAGRLQDAVEQRDELAARLRQQEVANDEVLDRVGQVESGQAEFKRRLDAVTEDVSVLQQPPEEPVPSEPEVEIPEPEPFTVSTFMRWGGRELVVIETADGYRSLGAGDAFGQFRVEAVDRVAMQATVTDTGSGEAAVYSPAGVQDKEQAP